MVETLNSGKVKDNPAKEISYFYIETRLYYYGARYYDPKTSIWLSADPALEKYLPTFPTKEKEVQKLTTNPMAYWAKELPGRGGVFNSPNLNVYAYTAQNPVKYIDPDGKSIKWAMGRAAMLMTARGRAATWRDIKEYGKFVAQSSKNLYHNVAALFNSNSIFITSIHNYSRYKIDNKIIHLFSNSTHNLAPLLDKFGGDKVKALEGILKATQNYIIKNPGVVRAKDGFYKVTVKVKNITLTVSGVIRNRAVEVGTAYIKNKK